MWLVKMSGFEGGGVELLWSVIESAIKNSNRMELNQR